MRPFVKKYLAPLLNRYTVFLLVLIVWTEILQRQGGLPSLRPAWRLEIPLLCYLYWLGNRLIRPSRLQPWTAAIPIVLLYVIFDVYHLQFGRLLRITEVAQIPELFQVATLSMKLLMVAAVGLPLAVFLLSIRIRRWPGALAGLAPLLMVILSISLFPDGFMAVFAKTQTDMVTYSDTMSAKNNGRLTMMLYNEAKRRSSLEKTAKYQGDSPYLKKYAKLTEQVRKQQGKRNVHLVVLESFLDPSLLGGAHFSKEPTHPDFAELMGGKGSLTVSPVFGGGTAQAEFEVLCGVPAMRELSGIEFDVFTGSKTLCLPHVLSEGGYQTLATNAYVPDFFNSTNAYTGMGFGDIYYPREYAPGRDSYVSTGDVTGETYMFDGDLLNQNLDFIAKKIQASNGQPIFNYIISMYGHLPHQINLEKRPQVLKLEGEFHDDLLERSANQFYYRTQAVAAFVKGLLRIDPNSLVILVSDHLPALTYGPNTYRELNYLAGVEKDINLNRIFFIENSKVVRYSTINHYEVPQIILNYVTQGQYCKDGHCGFTSGDTSDEEKTAYREEYLTIMARAML